MSVLSVILSATEARNRARLAHERKEPPPAYSDSRLSAESYIWAGTIERASGLGESATRIEMPFGRDDRTAYEAVREHFEKLGYTVTFSSSLSALGRGYDRFAVIVSWKD